MSMSPFYAYAIDRESNCDPRLLLTFASRAIADEWWREISKDPILSNNVRRSTPQFYTYGGSEVNLLQFSYRHKEIADKFVDHMVIQSENNSTGQSISYVPSVDITQYVSSNWFYIRSRLDPQLYWFYKEDENRIILADATSRYYGTRRNAFRITALGEPERAIMIGKDKITISIAPQVHIIANADGYLYACSGDAIEGFTFNDFAQGKFLADSERLVHDPDSPAQEVWELIRSHTRNRFENLSNLPRIS